MADISKIWSVDINNISKIFTVAKTNVGKFNKVNSISATTPTVTTQAVSSITTTGFTGNGNITSTGGANCTRRGFCYMLGTSGDPTTANSVVYDDGSFVAGSYTKIVTGLSSSTGYRVRAYAINSVGISYGATVQVTILSKLLTWPGSTHTEADIIAIGGTVYNAGGGPGSGYTIGRYPGANVPSGWTQALDWQRYSGSSGGGDYCGRWPAAGPQTFSNAKVVSYTYSGSSLGILPCTYQCANYPTKWIKFYSGDQCTRHEVASSYITTSQNRVEIGIY